MGGRVGISPKRGPIPQYLNKESRERSVTVTEDRKGPGVAGEGHGDRHRPSQGSRWGSGPVRRRHGTGNPTTQPGRGPGQRA